MSAEVAGKLRELTGTSLSTAGILDALKVLLEHGADISALIEEIEGHGHGPSAAHGLISARADELDPPAAVVGAEAVAPPMPMAADEAVEDDSSGRRKRGR